MSAEKTAVGEEEKKEDSEFAKASPEPGEDDKRVGFGLGIVENNNGRGDGEQRSLFGWKNNQRIGVGVHALSS